MSAINGYRILDVFPNGMDFFAPGAGGEQPSIGEDGYNKLLKYYDMKDKPFILPPIKFTTNKGGEVSLSARECVINYVAGSLSVGFITEISSSSKLGVAWFSVEYLTGNVTYAEAE